MLNGPVSMLAMEELDSGDIGGDAGRGGPGRVWLLMLYGCEAGWMYRKTIRNAFGGSLTRK